TRTDPYEEGLDNPSGRRLPLISIAMVEDQEETAYELSTYLDRYAIEKGQEFSITHFFNAEDFLKAFPGNFQLLLLDIQLPGLDGMSTAQEIRESGSDIPLIFITSLSQYAVRGYDVNALDFMVKPVVYYQFVMNHDLAF
ncbi:MAG: response regulator, partial [Aeriscardovia sp.]|nr:response regulator [Aeriscardovia sp.]